MGQFFNNLWKSALACFLIGLLLWGWYLAAQAAGHTEGNIFASLIFITGFWLTMRGVYLGIRKIIKYANRDD